MKKQSKLIYKMRIVYEVSTIRDASQWKLIRNRGKISGRIFVKYCIIRKFACQKKMSQDI